jgi:glycosyltransferase involved in cell wall biosynthesis
VIAQRDREDDEATAGSGGLRIALIAPPWFEIPPRKYGGIESVVFGLARGLCARGHDVTLVAAGPNHMPTRFIQTLPEPPSSRLGEANPEVVHAALASQALEDGTFDVIHDHSLAGPLLAVGRSTPTVVTAHSPMDGEMADYYRALRRHIHLVAISEAQRRRAPDLPWIRTVHNGIPVSEYPFEPAKGEAVLFLGRLGPEKGAHLAIEAAREAGYRLVMAGKCQEPPERRYFDELISPRMGPDVEWVDQVGGARKLELLSRARCLVFPIQWEEPFGIVMVEAMACGTPVVALDAGSVPEIVEDGVTGFVCEDLDDLAEGIKRADTIDPAECRRRAAERFDVSAMVDGYEAAYRSVLSLARNP